MSEHGSGNGQQGKTRSADCEDREALGEKARKLAGWTRFVAGVPCAGLFICSLTLVVLTTTQVGIVTFEWMGGDAGLMDLAIEYVEFTDMYLLAVVLYIMALGLFSLFITDEIELPAWLVFRDFDDLKERLVSVIVVMMGVHFLGVVLKDSPGLELLWLGLAVSAVILSLTVFSRLVFKGHHRG